jgi:glucose/arabinose dehydrogenase
MSKRLLLVGCASALLAVSGCSNGDNPGTDTGPGGTDAGRDGGATPDTGPPVDANVDAFVTPGEDTGVDAFVTPTDDAGTDAFVATVDGGMTDGCELGDTYPALELQPLHSFAGANDLPVGIVLAPGRDDLFVVLRNGTIVIMDPTTGAVGATPFIDVHTRLGTRVPTGGDEWGLLGLAFHPDYAANGLAYIAYTTRMTDTMLEDRVAVINRATADTATFGSDIFTITDRFPNHNGGQLGFGPDDGFLYYGVGDGGSGGDPDRTGQNTMVQLGKIHRFEVGPGIATYNPAPGNPFIGGGGLPTVWAYGVRNPWRFGWDRLTHDMFIADVGQNDWEEIDILAAGTGAGTNFGWSVCEGNHDYNGSCDALTGDTRPVAEYSHTDADFGGGGNASITGGYVYRGSAIPGLRGAYLFGDEVSSNFGALRNCAGSPVVLTPISFASGSCTAPTTFGEDRNGELLVACASGRNIRRIVAH